MLSARGAGVVLIFSWNFKQRDLSLIFKTCLTPFNTLEIRRALEPKCVPQLLMGSLLGMRWSAIGQFFPVPSKSLKSPCASKLDPVPFLFLKG